MKKGLMPIVLLFIIVNGFAIVFNKWLTAQNIDTDVVLWGNLLLFLLTLTGFFMYSKAVSTRKGNVMLLNVYGSFMLKFFAVAVGMLVYVFTAKHINRPGLYIAMALYLLYSFIAILNVVSLRKRSGHAERKSTV